MSIDNLLNDYQEKLMDKPMSVKHWAIQAQELTPGHTLSIPYAEISAKDTPTHSVGDLLMARIEGAWYEFSYTETDDHICVHRRHVPLSWRRTVRTWINPAMRDLYEKTPTGLWDKKKGGNND